MMPEDNWYRRTYGADPPTGKLDTTGRDPETDSEWKYVVDSAAFLLLLDSARLYGLIDGGPSVDVDRCRRVLERGRVLGFRPRPIPLLIADFLDDAVNPGPPLEPGE